MESFMRQISSVYKRKVTKESFRRIVDKDDCNPVMNQLLNKHIQRLEKRDPGSKKNRSKREKIKEKSISLLVAKLVNIFTNPDTIYIQQEDLPENNINASDDGDLKAKSEPYMYFIRNGRFTVHVKDDFITKPKIVVNDEEDGE